MSAPKTPGELHLPSMAGEPGTMEVLRVWLRENGGSEFSVMPIGPEPAIWGLVFADVARYAAQIYGEHGYDAATVLRDIVQTFKAEMGSPTDKVKDITRRGGRH
jgi:hypothetical protein